MLFVINWVLSTPRPWRLQLPLHRRRGKIALIPVGDVETTLLKSLLLPLEKRFGFPCSLAEPLVDIRFAFNSKRNQYFSTAILRTIATRVPVEAIRVLGVADVDLYVPHLNFVFGEALMDGKTAIISLYRLNPCCYGNNRDDELYAERALKEAVHELGHTFGLKHCSDPACVMFFSNSLADTDQKVADFCSTCRLKLVKGER